MKALQTLSTGVWIGDEEAGGHSAPVALDRISTHRCGNPLKLTRTNTSQLSIAVCDVVRPSSKGLPGTWFKPGRCVARMQHLRWISWTARYSRSF